MDGVVRQAIRAAGEILLTAGAIGLLFIGYLVWGTGLRAASAQRALTSELNQQWRQAPARGDAINASPEQFNVATGQPFAFIRIPAFGRQWRFTLIQGTALDSPADRHVRLQRLRPQNPLPNKPPPLAVPVGVGVVGLEGAVGELVGLGDAWG